MKTSHLAVAAMLAAMSAPALAQEQAESAPATADGAASAEDAAMLPTVTVNTDAAPRTITSAPLNGSILKQDRLRQGAVGSSDTAALLTGLPGVSANSGGGFSSMPVLRGLSEQRARIVIDNVPIDVACPNDMNSPLSYTDPQTIAAIAVVPGVSPVSMGGDNIAGVISVESAMPRFAGDGGTLIGGEASAFYRGNGDGFGGALSLTMAGRHLSATYTGSYTRSDNYKGGGDRGTVRSTEFAKTDHALALAAQVGGGIFEIKGGYHFSPYEGFANQYMDMTSNRSWFVQSRYRGVYTWGDVDFTASYRDTDHEMNFLADKLPGAMPMNTEVHTFTSALKLDLPVSAKDTLRVGGDYHHQWLDDYWPPVAGSMMMGPTPYINIAGGRRDRFGLFGEWEAQWSPAFSTSIGARLDRVTTNTGDVQPYGTGMMNMADAMAASAFNAADRHRADNNWSATALASWAAADGVAIELGYAHKARSPNLYERYAWGRGAMASQMIGWYGDGNGYVGDIDLKPERADTLSAALRLSLPGGASFKLSPYYTHVDDYIDAAFVQDLTDMMGMPSGFVQLRFANQQAEFHGIDASASLPLARHDNGATTLAASASWVHGRNLSDKGPLYHQMPFNAKVTLDHASGPFEAGAEVEFVADKTRVDATRHEPRTAGYALVNLRVAYTLARVLQGVKLSVEARNLFDKGYDLPLGGQSLGDLKATGILRPVPGQGRSVNLQLSTRF
ncbi:TonB-dependent receptor [Novosphingobium album (ex Liu et al. 2023)]|uniref:TonB-dependent receptor n=1 Tax=Novosphingobium album (ex Liu et al. 2023) TaxID=3031130 RepID=A0ABT5WJA7_9SPHN|nr:TonB-dependent receptor [Novosphingobium album (ex Liu et al. 2023)]MDE8650139.1 TonB-dependent receptor [Novosphingobium album (ex Liu et al. 2023)]